MIRPAELRDISRIAELLVFTKRTAYRDIFCDDKASFGELSAADIIDAYRGDPSMLADILVYDDGVVKGMLNRRTVGGDIEVLELYVEPCFQGCGVGCALLRQVQDEAARAGCGVFLWTIKENPASRAFYERCGFTTDGQTRPIEGTSVSDVRYGWTRG